MANIEKIYAIVGKQNLSKGIAYNGNKIHYINERATREGNYIKQFRVHSEHHDLTYYFVTISTFEGEVTGTYCDCPQFSLAASCKHVAATLFRYEDFIFGHVDQDIFKKKKSVSKSIMKQFLSPIVPTTKRELTLCLNLFFEENYYIGETVLGYKIKIGEQRLYSLNSKQTDFLRSYERKQSFYFGKDFTYDPAKHYFNSTDERILTFLQELSQLYSGRGGDYIPKALKKQFLSLLKEKTYTIAPFLPTVGIKEGNPFSAVLEKQEENYLLSLRDFDDYTVITNDFEYIALKGALYHLTPKVAQLISTFEHHDVDSLVFDSQDLETFSRSILPILRDDLSLDETVKGVITLTPPNVKLYFDFLNDTIDCKAFFVYGTHELSYFDQDTSILRDNVYETEVINQLHHYHFRIDVLKQQILLEEIDEIGTFLTEGIKELSLKYEVFTSTKFKETKVSTASNVRANFSIGQDNIMSYHFTLDGIEQTELINLLDSMHKKKKYFRLKNGNLLNLEEDRALQELDPLLEDLELSGRDLQKTEGTLPKYRAIYLDSLKKNKYHIIETDNLFDQMIEKFERYKDVKIDMEEDEMSILREYQRTGVYWLYNLYKCGFGGILADEMGLGKSIQLIYLIKLILKEKVDAKVLIVAPTSLVYNWQHEFSKFAPQLSYFVVAGTKKERHQMLEETTCNVYITTYGLVRQDQAFYQEIPFELIAIDEAQNIKNKDAQMTKVIKSLNANMRLALTGTPLENSVMELWSIFDFIMPGYLISSRKFQSKYQVKDMEEESRKRLESLNLQITPFLLRRRKKDVVKELPDKLENNIYLDLSEEQKKIYAAEVLRTKEEMNALIGKQGFPKAHFQILQLLTKLRQICIDPTLVFENYHGPSAKMEAVVDLVKQIVRNDHKILLFTTYRMALSIVKEKLEQENIKTYVIDGSVSSKKRMELVDKFNHDDTDVFLIMLRAGGTGLNLTSADVVIHLDLWWNPQVENQATDRAHRIGQRNKVEVIRLICKGTIEEKIIQLQEKKRELSDALIEGDLRDQNILHKLTKEDLYHLLSQDREDT